jgi:hypothetical protein
VISSAVFPKPIRRGRLRRAFFAEPSARYAGDPRVAMIADLVKLSREFLDADPANVAQEILTALDRARMYPMEEAPRSELRKGALAPAYILLRCPDMATPADPDAGWSIGWFDPALRDGAGGWMGDGGFELFPTCWSWLPVAGAAFVSSGPARWAPGPSQLRPVASSGRRAPLAASVPPNSGMSAGRGLPDERRHPRFFSR